MFTTNMRQGDAIPQSFNRYAYVQNDPVNFTDPLGLEMIAIWGRACVDGQCESYISGWIDFGGPGGRVTRRDLIGRNGGGGGGGGGQGRTRNPAIPDPPVVTDPPVLPPLVEQPPSDVRQDFRDFLQTMSSECKDALGNIGVLRKLPNLANTARFYDVNTLETASASRYVGARAGRQTLGQYFDSRGYTAFTVTGGRHSGIYTRGGISTFSGGESGLYFLLHEMSHLAYPRGRDLDASLGTALGLTRGAGERWSNAVSRFFNSGCTQKGP